MRDKKLPEFLDYRIRNSEKGAFAMETLAQLGREFGISISDNFMQIPFLPMPPMREFLDDRDGGGQNNTQTPGGSAPKFKNEKSAQRGSLGDGHPADVRGSFTRISRPKTSVRAVKILENKHFGTDIHDPKARTSTTLGDFQKLWSEKLWAEFSSPKSDRNLRDSPQRRLDYT